MTTATGSKDISGVVRPLSCHLAADICITSQPRKICLVDAAWFGQLACQGLGDTSCPAKVEKIF